MHSNVLSLLVALCAVFATATGRFLDLDENYKVEVDITGEDDTAIITFTFTVNKLGYIGFGIGPHPNMTDADLFIGGVNTSTGELYGKDYHGTGNEMPVEDCETCQNWNVMWGNETDGVTLLKAERLLDTRDTEEDIKIEDAEIYVLWSYGEFDELVHHYRRGVRLLNLITADDSPGATTSNPSSSTETESTTPETITETTETITETTETITETTETETTETETTETETITETTTPETTETTTPETTTPETTTETTTQETTSTTTVDPSSTADPSSTTTADPSSTTTADPSSTTTADPSSTTTADPSSTTTADPSSTTTADPSSTTTSDSSSTTTTDPGSSTTDSGATSTTLGASTLLLGIVAFVLRK